MIDKMYKWFLPLALVGCFNANAQLEKGQVLDKVIGVVGEHIILQSEISQALAEFAAQKMEVNDSTTCMIMENLISQYVLCEQAARDSITVSDEEVEANLENRVRYMINAYGSEENMETTIGKTTYQLKEEYRKVFKDKMLAERMQSNVMSNIKVSPQEVRDYFASVPKDSLPMYPSSLEVGQIVLHPTPSQDVEEYAKQQLEDIKKQIKEGKADFATMAGLYSADCGSRDKGGELGVMMRDDLVPEFSAAAFKLQNNEISPVVKTEYGYHIIQMMQRMGEKAKMRHILIKPTITSIDLDKTTKLADSIKTELEAGRLKFIDAVSKFSEDKRTKNTGGMLSNPNTGGSFLSMEELEPQVALEVGGMKANNYSKPLVFESDGCPGDKTLNNKKVRIVYLKNITEPHEANLHQDFGRIQQAALAKKQNAHLAEWLNEKTKNVYLNIDQDYHSCSGVQSILNKK